MARGCFEIRICVTKFVMARSGLCLRNMFNRWHWCYIATCHSCYDPDANSSLFLLGFGPVSYLRPSKELLPIYLFILKRGSIKRSRFVGKVSIEIG